MIKDHIKAYTSLTTVCLLWTASTLVKPIYISSRFALRAIGKANGKHAPKENPEYDSLHDCNKHELYFEDHNSRGTLCAVCNKTISEEFFKPEE